jgi:hypothetical protein
MNDYFNDRKWKRFLTEGAVERSDMLSQYSEESQEAAAWALKQIPQAHSGQGAALETEIHDYLAQQGLDPQGDEIFQIGDEALSVAGIMLGVGPDLLEGGGRPTQAHLGATQTSNNLNNVGYELASGTIRQQKDKEVLNWLIDSLIGLSPEFKQGFQQGSEESRDIEDRENI